MESDSISKIVMIGFLVLMSAFFSATETAFSSLNRIRVKNMAESGNRRADLVLKLSENYDKLLSTILVGNNIVNIMMASIATVLFVSHLGNIGATVSTIVTTVIVLIFGEISPKSLAKESPETFAMFSAPILRVLLVVLTPINFFFSQWKILLSRLFKTTNSQGITEAELLYIVEEAEQDGAINAEDKELINSVIEFNDRRVMEILTPRVDIVAAPKDATQKELTKLFIQTGYSRIPVYDGAIDNIIGVIHLHDFFTLSADNFTSIDSIITNAVYITETIKISNLLKLFQETKSHMAVIIDEYGGTAGIITMEDILEELVGEIWDEHDEIINEIEQLDDNTYRIMCSVEIDKVFELFDLTIETDSSTLSGWIMELLGKIPSAGDFFDYENITVTIDKTDERHALECTITSNQMLRSEFIEKQRENQ